MSPIEYLFQWLICVLWRGHKIEFCRNLYGDEINEWGARSLWRCKHCGTIERGLSLHKEDE